MIHPSIEGRTDTTFTQEKERFEDLSNSFFEVFAEYIPYGNNKDQLVPIIRGHFITITNILNRGGVTITLTQLQSLNDAIESEGLHSLSNVATVLDIFIKKAEGKSIVENTTISYQKSVEQSLSA